MQSIMLSRAKGPSASVPSQPTQLVAWYRGKRTVVWIILIAIRCEVQTIIPHRKGFRTLFGCGLSQGKIVTERSMWEVWSDVSVFKLDSLSAGHMPEGVATVALTDKQIIRCCFVEGMLSNPVVI